MHKDIGIIVVIQIENSTKYIKPYEDCFHTSGIFLIRNRRSFSRNMAQQTQQPMNIGDAISDFVL